MTTPENDDGERPTYAEYRRELLGTKHVDPHYYVYVEAILGPIAEGRRFPLSDELRHAARVVITEHSDGRREWQKDKRQWPESFGPLKDFEDELQCVCDAFGHLSTGGDRVVHQDLLKDAFALLDYFSKIVRDPMYHGATSQQDAEHKDDV